MGIKQRHDTATMAIPREDTVLRRRPRPTEAANRSMPTGDMTVGLRRHHVLKVMVVVTGWDRSDGLQLAMRRWGHEVAAVHHGLIAIETARESHPDVLVLEIDTPRFGRCHLAGHLRNELATADGLIIGMTRHADSECRRHCQESGVDVVLSMPVNPEVLETLLWMEGIRLNRMISDTGIGPGIRSERPHEHEWVDPFLVGHAEVTYQQMATLERIREAAGQTS